ncbi:MAG: 3-hydroxyacyl-CoA dehydrogenase/enoyl-CoA hydratase family protein [Candidatus Aminicenantes bacterium]|jgi:3-hydroxyacyl-CoA dehydrogenase/enoyl-CoA hydratase/carnithine racemase
MKKRGSQDRKTARGITWDDVEILVIGAGTMGASLAQAYAQSGFNVGIVDVTDEILERALQTIDRELEDALKSGIFSLSRVEEIKGRILATQSYEEACGGKNLDLVIETATEDIEIKKEIFQKLDKLCAPDVVLASNTSSLDVNILAEETNRPDKVVWMHFFYLPHKNRAGEYAGSDTASKESIDKAAKYMKLAGKVTTPILSSRKGGAADVIFVSLLLEAARMVDDGFDIPSIEAAGKKAFGIPMGFLSLMDANGIPLGIHTMNIFSDSSNPDDSLYKAYGNFFTPPESYKSLLDRYLEAEDKSSVRWVSEDDAQTEAKDLMLIDTLKNRFLAVAFMTSVEVVETGVIEIDEVDKLCQNAFVWREGPFALMNKMGMMEVMRIVTERMELSHRKAINFPIPKVLINQAQKGEPWPLNPTPIIFSVEQNGRAARIMISNPRTSNALDNQVFEGLKDSFKQANEDSHVRVIIFDSAPIKTFIAGANVPYFIRAIRENNFKDLKKDIAFWQDVVFHEMTGGGKPKIAIVDGAAIGGGAEVAMALALDPDSIVIATERTSYMFPEVRLGIYPGLRGTLTLPQIIFKATDDEDLAVALSRYYILAGGTTTSSPRILKFLGLADLLVPARRREEAAEKLVLAAVDNGGTSLTQEQIATLKIEELPLELTFEEKEELAWIKDLFLKPDLIPILHAFARGQAEISLSGISKPFVQRIAERVANHSSHAVQIADSLISRGFSEFIEGKSIDELAQYELDNYLERTFQHPDAIEGLTAQVERRSPEFSRQYPA